MGGNPMLGGSAMAVIIGVLFIVVALFSGDELGLKFGQKLLSFFIGIGLIFGGLIFSKS